MDLASQVTFLIDGAAKCIGYRWAGLAFPEKFADVQTKQRMANAKRLCRPI
jgi:hypothetical protein